MSTKRYFRLNLIDPVGNSPPILGKYLPIGRQSGKTPEIAATKFFSDIFEKIANDWTPTGDWKYDFSIYEVTKKSNQERFYFRGSVSETNHQGLTVFEPSADLLNGSGVKSARR